MKNSNNRNINWGANLAATAVSCLALALILALIRSIFNITLGALPTVLLFLAVSGIVNLIMGVGKRSASPNQRTYSRKTNAVTETVTETVIAPPIGKSALPAWFYLFLAFFVPFIFMFLSFALAGVSPFGTNQILATDLWHQYYPFLADYHSKLQSGGSLLWTWTSGGGTNYLGLMAYYLASPLNLISALFPAEILREFLFVATCVKIGLAGLFFALFLRITFKRTDISITAFGIMYALCAFIMGYYWNVIWLDTIALLPLVVAGTIALLKEGKFRLYIAALALSVLANYYMGLFTCIFVVLVSIGYTFVEWKGWRKTLRDFFKMLGCSVTAVMISAVLTLPAFLALKHTHSSNNAFPTGFSVNMGGTPDLAGVISGFGKTIANSLAFIQPNAKDGLLPNIYCGVFTIFLAILFLFCSKIKRRERIFCGALLVFFIFSFISRRLDYIWHGFHFPNMLYFRFSFLFSFVMLYMAFRVFMHIDSVKPVAVIAAIGGFLVYLGVASAYYHGEGGPSLSSIFTSADGNNPDPVVLSGFFGLLIALWVTLYAFRSRLSRRMQAIFSAVIGVGSMIFLILSANTFASLLTKNKSQTDATGFIIAVIVILLLIIITVFIALNSKQFNQQNRALRGMLSVVLMVLALIEGLLSAASGVNTVGVTDTKWYPLGTTDTLSLVETMKEREADTVDLYHAEVNKYYTLNDNALIGVNGISMFSSMVNSKITDYMEKFGICGWIESNRYTYQESSPFTNLMLNVKYLISHNSAHLDKTHMSLVKSSGSVNLLQNTSYLPMGFLVKDSLLDYDVATLQRTDPLANQNLFFKLSTGIDGELYQDIPSASETSTEITAVAPHDGIAVAYVTSLNKESRNLSIKVNGTQVVSQYIQRPFIMMVGSVNAGDTLSCSSGAGSISGRFAMMDESLFQQARSQFARSTLRATKVSDTCIRGNINAVEDGLFYTSIPFIDGWKAYVDGEEVEITPVGNALIAFKLSKGPHIVEMTYSPEGFPSGLIVTIVGLLIFAVMIVLSRRKINLIDRYLVPRFAHGTSDATEPASDGSSAAASSTETSREAEPAGDSAPTNSDAPDMPVGNDDPTGDKEIDDILSSLNKKNNR